MIKNIFMGSTYDDTNSQFGLLLDGVVEQLFYGLAVKTGSIALQNLFVFLFVFLVYGKSYVFRGRISLQTGSGPPGVLFYKDFLISLFIYFFFL